MNQCGEAEFNKAGEGYNIYLVALVVGMAGAIVLTFVPGLGRGCFLHIIFGIFAGAIGLGLLFVERLVVHFKLLKSHGRVVNAVAIVLLMSFFSIFGGVIVCDRDIRDAKEFCEELVPLLDAYKLANGEYPENISEVTGKGKKLPMIVRNDGCRYSKEGESFSFSFPDPGGMMNGWGYSAKDKSWYEWD